MNSSPQVSVVMSVYNSAGNLAETLDSILMQEGCRFEFIVVDDGSTDDTANILDTYASRDSRLKVLYQKNTGLTRALINGCNLACGDFIARQDAGDISLPGRLKQQLDFLSNHSDAVMCGCAVLFTGPQHEPLYETSKPMLQLDSGFRTLDIQHLSGPPHHGATLFRRDAYVQVGGYRAIFAVAQDIDLWLRLSEKGLCLGMPEVLYQARLEAGSISSRRRSEQFRAGNLAIDCARIRRSGGSDQSLLHADIPELPKKKPISRAEKARFHYFIASCLRGHDRAAAKRYYRQVLKDNPLHLKALFRLAMN